jgi:hypothetical protein
METGCLDEKLERILHNVKSPYLTKLEQPPSKPENVYYMSLQYTGLLTGLYTVICMYIYIYIYIHVYIHIFYSKVKLVKLKLY